jgi:methylenetetrahydrofolate dehydrogenase (NADP+)/methenyltetrahydrofolate cyclohydrolase
LVTACGRAHSIGADDIKDGAIVVDGGISQLDGKTVGDINPDGLEKKRGWRAPVPGGVGPLTIAHLLENVYLLAKSK